MPWRKTRQYNARGQVLYRSPRGTLFTKRQVKAYYATKGFKRAVRAKR